MPNTDVYLVPKAKLSKIKSLDTISENTTTRLGMPDAVETFKAQWQQIQKNPDDLSEIMTLQQLLTLSNLFSENDTRSKLEAQITLLKVINSCATAIFEQDVGKQTFANALSGLSENQDLKRLFENEGFAINFVNYAPDCIKQLSDKELQSLVDRFPHNLPLAMASHQAKANIRVKPFIDYLAFGRDSITTAQILINAKHLLRLFGLSTLTLDPTELTFLITVILLHKSEFTCIFRELEQNKKPLVIIDSKLLPESDAVDFLTKLSEEKLQTLLARSNYDLSICKVIMRNPALSEKIKLNTESQCPLVQKEYLAAGKKQNEVIGGKWFDHRRNTALKNYFKDQILHPFPKEFQSQAVYYCITAREPYMSLLMELAPYSWMSSKETLQKEKMAFEDSLITKSPFFRAYLRNLTMAQIATEYPGYMQNFLKLPDPDFSLIMNEILISANWEQFQKLLQFEYWSLGHVNMLARRCLQLLRAGAIISPDQLTGNKPPLIIISAGDIALTNEILTQLPLEMIQTLSAKNLKLLLTLIEVSKEELSIPAWLKLLAINEIKEKASSMLPRSSAREIISTGKNSEVAISLASNSLFESILSEEQLKLPILILQGLFRLKKLEKCSWFNLGEAYLDNQEKIQSLHQNPETTNFVNSLESLIITALTQEKNFQLVKRQKPHRYLPKFLSRCSNLIDHISAMDRDVLTNNPELVQCLVVSVLEKQDIIGTLDVAIIQKLYNACSATDKHLFKTFAQLNVKFALNLLLGEDFNKLDGSLLDGIAQCLNDSGNKPVNHQTWLFVLDRIGHLLKSYLSLLSQAFKACSFSELKTFRYMFATLYQDRSFLESIANEKLIGILFNKEGELYDETLAAALSLDPYPQTILSIDDKEQVVKILNKYPALMTAFLSNIANYTLSYEDIVRIQASNSQLSVEKLAEYINANDHLIAPLIADPNSPLVASLASFLVTEIKADVSAFLTFKNLIAPLVVPVIGAHQELAAQLINIAKSDLDAISPELHPKVVNSLKTNLKPSLAKQLLREGRLSNLFMSGNPQLCDTILEDSVFIRRLSLEQLFQLFDENGKFYGISIPSLYKARPGLLLELLERGAEVGLRILKNNDFSNHPDAVTLRGAVATPFAGSHQLIRSGLLTSIFTPDAIHQFYNANKKVIVTAFCQCAQDRSIFDNNINLFMEFFSDEATVLETLMTPEADKSFIEFASFFANKLNSLAIAKGAIYTGYSFTTAIAPVHIVKLLALGSADITRSLNSALTVNTKLLVDFLNSGLCTPIHDEAILSSIISLLVNNKGQQLKAEELVVLLQNPKIKATLKQSENTAKTDPLLNKIATADNVSDRAALKMLLTNRKNLTAAQLQKLISDNEPEVITAIFQDKEYCKVLVQARHGFTRTQQAIMLGAAAKESEKIPFLNSASLETTLRDGFEYCLANYKDHVALLNQLYINPKSRTKFFIPALMTPAVKVLLEIGSSNEVFNELSSSAAPQISGLDIDYSEPCYYRFLSAVFMRRAEYPIANTALIRSLLPKMSTRQETITLLLSDTNEQVVIGVLKAEQLLDLKPLFNNRELAKKLFYRHPAIAKYILQHCNQDESVLSHEALYELIKNDQPFCTRLFNEKDEVIFNFLTKAKDHMPEEDKAEMVFYQTMVDPNSVMPIQLSKPAAKQGVLGSLYSILSPKKSQPNIASPLFNPKDLKKLNDIGFEDLTKKYKKEVTKQPAKAAAYLVIMLKRGEAYSDQTDFGNGLTGKLGMAVTLLSNFSTYVAPADLWNALLILWADDKRLIYFQPRLIKHEMMEEKSILNKLLSLDVYHPHIKEYFRKAIDTKMLSLLQVLRSPLAALFKVVELKNLMGQNSTAAQCCFHYPHLYNQLSGSDLFEIGCIAYAQDSVASLVALLKKSNWLQNTPLYNKLFAQPIAEPAVVPVVSNSIARKEGLPSLGLPAFSAPQRAIPTAPISSAQNTTVITDSLPATSLEEEVVIPEPNPATTSPSVPLSNIIAPLPAPAAGVVPPPPPPGPPKAPPPFKATAKLPHASNKPKAKPAPKGNDKGLLFSGQDLTARLEQNKELLKNKKYEIEGLSAELIEEAVKISQFIPIAIGLLQKIMTPGQTNLEKLFKQFQDNCKDSAVGADFTKKLQAAQVNYLANQSLRGKNSTSEQSASEPHKPAPKANARGLLFTAEDLAARFETNKKQLKDKKYQIEGLSAELIDEALNISQFVPIAIGLLQKIMDSSEGNLKNLCKQFQDNCKDQSVGAGLIEQLKTAREKMIAIKAAREKGSSNKAGGGDIGSALASAMAARRLVIDDSNSTDPTSNDDNWDSEPPSAAPQPKQAVSTPAVVSPSTAIELVATPMQANTGVVAPAASGTAPLPIDDNKNKIPPPPPPRDASSDRTPPEPPSRDASTSNPQAPGASGKSKIAALKQHLFLNNKPVAKAPATKKSAEKSKKMDRVNL